MNIFATNIRPDIVAKEHCDRHVIKMILETAQMLSTAHWILDNKIVGYKPTHWNHPCSSWIRESKSNYLWGVELLSSLCSEYRLRYLKSHKTEEILDSLRTPPKSIPNGNLTAFAQALPDEMESTDPVESYKTYIISKFHEWAEREKPMKVTYTCREAPEWIQEEFGMKTVYRPDGRITITLSDK